MDYEKKIEEIEDLFIEGEVGDALKLMRKFPGIDRKLENEIILHLGRWNRTKKQVNLGLLSSDEQRRYEAQINFAGLESIKYLQRIVENKVPGILKVISGPGGSVSQGKEILEKITGKADFKPITWLFQGYKQSSAVCRIISKQHQPIGTGFLIGQHYLMTNNHVIEKLADAENMFAQFDFEIGLDEKPKTTSEYSFTTNESEFQTNGLNNFDYTVIKLDQSSNEKSLSDFGHLNFEEQVPKESDPVSIIQHPQGQMKQIAMTDNLVTKVDGNNIEYRTDTLAGSSGSPVFNYDWKVVGLHRAASGVNDANIATQVGIILKELKLNYSA